MVRNSGGDVFRLRMVVQDHRDEQHGQDQAKRNAVAKFVPDREDRDFMADAPALHIAPEQISPEAGSALNRA